MVQLLIADADPASVFATKRLVTRDLGCRSVEVDNGLDALHELSRQSYAGLLVACDLPGIGAMEVIASVRSCPDTRDLPIVVMAAERSETAIRELARCGVRYCLAKPLDVAHAKARLRSILEAPARRRGGPGHAGLAGFDDCLELEDGAPVLVADADADFRHFFSTLLGGRYRVLAASSGAEALKMAGAAQPAVICAGDHLGPLDRCMLARKVRELRTAPAPRILAVTGRTAAADAHGTGLFDGVVVRTFVPARFLEQFERFVARPSSLRRLLARAPDLRGALLSATEQTCGMLMALDLEPCTRRIPFGPAGPSGPPGPAVPPGPGFAAVVDLAVRLDDETLGLRCTVSAPACGAAVMAARMLGLAESDLSDADLSSVLGELANIVTGRLQNTLQERQLPTRCGLPRLLEPRCDLPAVEARALEAVLGVGPAEPLICVALAGLHAADPALAALVPRPVEPAVDAAAAAGAEHTETES